MNWIIFAFLSSISASLVAVFSKIGLQNINSTLATTIRSIIMALFLITIVLVQGNLKEVGTIFSNHKALLFIILSGIAGALSWLFYFFSLKNADILKVVSIDKLSIIFTLIFTFLILGEKISIKSAIGAALMVVGSILMIL